jgi:hypothetical protein
MFTGTVPHGTEYRKIGAVFEPMGFLDDVVARMIRQAPNDRPRNIGEVKALIQRHQAEAVTLQRLSEIKETVVRVGEIDNPLAHEPPQLIDAEWNNGTLQLTLNRPVNNDWVKALRNMGSFSSVMGIPPNAFTFQGNVATVRSSEQEAQHVINYFKTWLPNATTTLRHSLEHKVRQEEAKRREELRQAQAAEEQRLRVNRNLKI